VSNQAILVAVSVLPVVIWLYLLLRRGLFWSVRRSLPPAPVNRPTAAAVAVVIPARNEADVIGRAITSLLRQDYDGNLHIVLVDDASSDGTAETAKQAASGLGRDATLTILCSKPLPDGWTGKMWAVSQGVELALERQPDFLLLTDADIEHMPGNLRQLISWAESRNLDLASLMVKLRTATFAERILIPAFVFFFFMLYPPAWVASGKRKTAAAAGGCMLIRPAALQGAGGIAAICGEIIDDCALARRVKRTGGRVGLGLTSDASSIRSYGGFRQIENMISRTAFNQLRHATALLLATAIGLLFTYVLPVALLCSGVPAAMICGALALGMMARAYIPLLRFYRRNPLWAVSLPLVAVFYLYATLHSAANYWRGRGGEWKGRAQDL
jgi:hopene-associated glycosyltransferase HpnB